MARGAIGGLVLLALACSGLGRLGYERSLEHTAPAASHAVHDARLQEVMRSLERLRAERLPKAMDVGSEVNVRRDEIAQVAHAMAESARDIAPPSWLSPEQTAEFVDQAERFGRLAAELADAAPRLPSQALREHVATLQASCDDCHGRCRVPLQQDRPAHER